MPSTPTTKTTKSRKIEETPVIKIEPNGKMTEFIKDPVSPKTNSKLAQWWHNLSVNQKRLVVALSILVPIFIVLLGLLLFRAFGLGKWGTQPNDGKNSTSESATKTEVAVYESPLTGNLITKTKYEEITQHRPLSIMIENQVDARPQSGLNQADVVWEALAEGGISRFMAIYLENSPDKVGPVRSLRKYFLDWNAELRDGLIMHIGTADTDDPNTDALGFVTTYNVKALGFLLENSSWRVSDRYAPHNAYSSTSELWRKSEDKGWSGIVELDKWKFKADVKVVTLNEVKPISFDWWQWEENDYSVTWEYDSNQNIYLRSQGNEAHVDSETGDQLDAKNVVFQICDAYYTVDTDGKTRLVYDLIGEGPAKIFLDGTEIEGTWKKSDRIARTKYFDEAGQEIEFNRGRTWISVLPTGSNIEY